MENKSQVLLTNDEINAMANDAIVKVFETMLSTNAKFIEELPSPKNPSEQPVAKPLNTAEDMLASCVGFSGDTDGIIYLYIEESLSILITSRLLGMTADEVKAEGVETVNDALGELANMSVGTFKNKLCDLGFSCRLTIPSVLRGKQFSIQTVSGDNITRKLYKFDIEGHPFIMDLLIKQN